MKKKSYTMIPAALLVGAVGLYFSNWAPRDLDTVTGRVEGHWRVHEAPRVDVNAQHAREYYFGPLDAKTGQGRLTRVDNEGVTHHATWRVLKDFPGEDRVRVAFQHSDGKEIATLSIKPDGEELRVGGPLGLMEAFAHRATYVDADTSPALLDAHELLERIQMFSSSF